MLIVTNGIRIPLREIHFTFVKGAGPGGQKINKSNSRAVLTWNIVQNKTLPDGMKSQIVNVLGRRISGSGDLIIRSDRFRDRGRNIADCLEKLRELLVKSTATKKARLKTKTPAKATLGRRRIKEHKSEKKKWRQKVRV
ncbi:MAG: aminoacyl-tRNA hydrolase [Bdellovibrionales bacterium]|nr:aminoacyl-tRNA hydrolase [Bdellovibrionales bacterium]